MAQNERESIKKRQAEGIAVAKARGVKFGRPVKQLPDDFDDIVSAWSAKKITLQNALQICQISAATFYRRIGEMRKKD